MSNNDEILKKLLKITAKQQKIITKLAQSTINSELWRVNPISFDEALAPILGSLRGFKIPRIKILNFHYDINSKKLEGKISTPDEWFPTVLKALKTYLPNRKIKISNKSTEKLATITNNIDIQNLAGNVKMAQSNWGESWHIITNHLKPYVNSAAEGLDNKFVLKEAKIQPNTGAITGTIYGPGPTAGNIQYAFDNKLKNSLLDANLGNYTEDVNGKIIRVTNNLNDIKFNYA